jgi:hypothetical protein
VPRTSLRGLGGHVARRPGQSAGHRPRIPGGTATVFHAWGDRPRGPFTMGWEQARAKILPDGSLHWGYPGKFSLRLTVDGQELDGEYAWGGQIARITLRRVS